MKGYNAGRSATYLARAQKISRQMVYDLVNGYNKEGADFLLDKKVGRPCLPISGTFAERVEKIRKETDYGSEKIHFVLTEQGFSVSLWKISQVFVKEGFQKPKCKPNPVLYNPQKSRIHHAI